MSVTIRQVYVENFRSIHRITVPAKPLSIFVGKNDCGKSNILRALNLFFNGVTSPGKAFVFEDDYNLFVPERAKVAKEVVVRVELNIPQSYWETNGQVIVWEKRWRASGEHSNEYWGKIQVRALGCRSGPARTDRRRSRRPRSVSHFQSSLACAAP